MASAGGAGAAAAPDPALYFQPVDERDAVVTLLLPPEAKEAAEQPTTRGGKRRRSEAAAAAERIVTHDASAYLLKSASPKFRAALERWNESGAKELKFKCGSEEEAECWGHLLDCIHSMGRQLPPDLDAVLRLLLLAREQAAEPVVAACLWQLSSKADQLPAAACLALLSHLETGVSEHAELRSLGSNLLAAACGRTLQLLSQDAAVRSDAAVQAQLLAYLGPLQHMLNDLQRRDLFLSLPFELLRDCIFLDGNVNADAEVTVLAAFAMWADANLNYGGSTGRDIIAICSRIRFPALPAGMLRNYWDHWTLLRHYFDPMSDVMYRAIVASSDPQQLRMWRRELDKEGNADDESAVARFKAKCSSWWRPRDPPLAATAGPAEFEVKLERPDAGDAGVNSIRKYWMGYWWSIMATKEESGRLGIYIMPSIAHQGSSRNKGTPEALSFCMEVDYKFSLSGSNCSWTRSSRGFVYPCQRTGHGFRYCKADNGQRITWDAFWEEGSPWLVHGAAHVCFTLQVPA
ncbi:secretion system E [Chlorella sorokiniana]|uniref:Secretion system E n=1 Tax=Chlorella sorokiniana TaxID=3076 RepID=A0A2P6TIQ8_CHLSO|nr:secretion system E [Chlorella sorokiniana]|eukprot:PRW39125.1 secretion system E [Chlorella sorokiniana]